MYNKIFSVPTLDYFMPGDITYEKSGYNTAAISWKDMKKTSS